MNRMCFLFAGYFCFSCGDHEAPAIQHIIIREEPSVVKPSSGDTALVDLSYSEILWKGTKMHGMGKHQGQIELGRGYLLTEGERISGGLFVVHANHSGN